MAAQPVYTFSRLEQWQYAVKPWLSGSLSALLFISLVVCAYWIIPSREVADVRGAVTRHGSGVVTSFTCGFVDQAGRRSPDQVNIVLNGNQVSYSGIRFLLLRKGQRVEVTYRTGKSGNVYVTDIMPEGEAKP